MHLSHLNHSNKSFGFWCVCLQRFSEYDADIIHTCVVGLKTKGSGSSGRYERAFIKLQVLDRVSLCVSSLHLF